MSKLNWSEQQTTKSTNCHSKWRERRPVTWRQLIGLIWTQGMSLSIMMCQVVAFSRVSLAHNASIPAFFRLAVLGPHLVHAYYPASGKGTFPVQNKSFKSHLPTKMNFLLRKIRISRFVSENWRPITVPCENVLERTVEKSSTKWAFKTFKRWFLRKIWIL